MPQVNNPNNQSLSNEPAEQVEQLQPTFTVSRAQVIYDQPGTDVETAEDEPDLLGADTDELDDVDLDGLVADPEAEPEEEEDLSEGSPAYQKFADTFEKVLGSPLKETVDAVRALMVESQERSVREQKYELSAHWQVPVDEVDRRVAITSQLWKKLPADKQQQYDNPKGAIALYAKYEASKGTKQGVQTSTKAVNQRATKYDFTQTQIDKMTVSEYEANIGAITKAYQQGRVLQK